MNVYYTIETLTSITAIEYYTFIIRILKRQHLPD